MPAFARIASNTSVPNPWPCSIEATSSALASTVLRWRSEIANEREIVLVSEPAPMTTAMASLWALRPWTATKASASRKRRANLDELQDRRVDVPVDPIARRLVGRQAQDAFKRLAGAIVGGQARCEGIQSKIAGDASDGLRPFAQRLQIVPGRVERFEHLGFDLGEHLAVGRRELLQRRAQRLHVGLAVGCAQQRGQVDEQDLVRVAGLEQHVAHGLGRLAQALGSPSPFGQIEDHRHKAAGSLERVGRPGALANLGQELGDAFEDPVLVLVDGHPAQREAVGVLQALVDVEVGEPGHEHSVLVDGDVGLVGEQERGEDHRLDAQLHAEGRRAPQRVDLIDADAGVGVREELARRFPQRRRSPRRNASEGGRSARTAELPWRWRSRLRSRVS